MNKKKHDIVPDYITGQVITYFFLSIMVMLAAARTTDKPLADKPIFFLDKSGIIPLPIFNIHFNLAYWMLTILSLIFLCLSVSFLVALFRRHWTYKAENIAHYLSIPVSTLVLLCFILSWLAGLNSLLTTLESGIIAGIFIYSSFLVFLGLVFQTIRNMARSS